MRTRPLHAVGLAATVILSSSPPVRSRRRRAAFVPVAVIGVFDPLAHAAKGVDLGSGIGLRPRADHRIRHVTSFVAFATILSLAVAVCAAGCRKSPVISMKTDIKYGGRAVAIATHPTDNKTAFVVSESGGIFKTRNGGSHWSQQSGSGTFWFSDVLVYAPNPNIVIATAYRDWKTENGGGIWRSTDGGDTWSHVAVSIPAAVPPTWGPLEAFCIAVEPGSNRIWVGTSVGLAYSNDQGSTWSFLPTTPNFIHVPVWAVIAPQARHLRVLTENGFRASNDGGLTWLQPIQGLLPVIRNNVVVHNQLAASPQNDAVLYWSGVVGDWERGYSVTLVRSVDGGLTWRTQRSDAVKNRPSFVRVASRAVSGDDKYQVYYGNGSVFTRRFNVDKATESVSAWQVLNTAHPDSSDIGFKSDGFSPWLLVGDGGILTTKDQGATWKLTAGAGAGYNALQISDAVGQKHAGDRESDLYFGTQDVHFLGLGRQWSHVDPQHPHGRIPPQHWRRGRARGSQQDNVRQPQHRRNRRAPLFGRQAHDCSPRERPRCEAIGRPDLHEGGEPSRGRRPWPRVGQLQQWRFLVRAW